MKIDLSKQKVLVTGASRGIGREIALQLSKCGAKVAIHYHQSENAIHRLAAEMNSKTTILKADLSQPLEVITLVIDAINKMKGLDVVVNNAAIATFSPLKKDDLDWFEEWTDTMMVNLNAVALICKKTVEYFSGQKGGGRIINIASRAAFRGDTEDYLAYAASKGGMVSLTKSLARAYGKHNIKSFLIAPGFVKTDMAFDFIKKYGEKYVVDDLALSEITQPKDLAPLVCFIASGMMDHATGTTIDVNAGSYLH